MIHEVFSKSNQTSEHTNPRIYEIMHSLGIGAGIFMPEYGYRPHGTQDVNVFLLNTSLVWESVFDCLC